MISFQPRPALRFGQVKANYDVIKQVYQQDGEAMARKVHAALEEVNAKPFIQRLERQGIHFRLDVLPKGLKVSEEPMPPRALGATAPNLQYAGKSEQFIRAAVDCCRPEKPGGDEVRLYRKPRKSDPSAYQVDFYLRPRNTDYNPKQPALVVSVDTPPASYADNSISQHVRMNRLLWQGEPENLDANVFTKALKPLTYPILLGIAESQRHFGR